MENVAMKFFCLKSAVLQFNNLSPALMKTLQKASNSLSDISIPFLMVFIFPCQRHGTLWKPLRDNFQDISSDVNFYEAT